MKRLRKICEVTSDSAATVTCQMVLVSDRLLMLEASFVSVFLLAHCLIQATVTNSVILAFCIPPAFTGYCNSSQIAQKSTVKIIALCVTYISVYQYGSLFGLLGCFVGTTMSAAVHWLVFSKEIQIRADSCGHSYDAVLGRLIDDSLTAVELDDAYIRRSHQIWNFVRFCEMLVKRAPNLASITLTTGEGDDDKSQQDQRDAFGQLDEDLKKRGICLTVNYSRLHDREIRFNTGWIVKLGRGLDYFKYSPRFALGYCDMDLRPCHETTVDIIRRAPT